MGSIALNCHEPDTVALPTLGLECRPSGGPALPPMRLPRRSASRRPEVCFLGGVDYFAPPRQEASHSRAMGPTYRPMADLIPRGRERALLTHSGHFHHSNFNGGQFLCWSYVVFRNSQRCLRNLISQRQLI